MVLPLSSVRLKRLLESPSNSVEDVWTKPLSREGSLRDRSTFGSGEAWIVESSSNQVQASRIGRYMADVTDDLRL